MRVGCLASRAAPAALGSAAASVTGPAPSQQPATGGSAPVGRDVASAAAASAAAAGCAAAASRYPPGFSAAASSDSRCAAGLALLGLLLGPHGWYLATSVMGNASSTIGASAAGAYFT